MMVSLVAGPLCMANGCSRVATYDLETWPLCRHDYLVKQDTARRWGGQQHAPGTHARKEILGGFES